LRACAHLVIGLGSVIVVIVAIAVARLFLLLPLRLFGLARDLIGREENLRATLLQ
jgi:hypothetical protein